MTAERLSDDQKTARCMLYHSITITVDSCKYANLKFPPRHTPSAFSSREYLDSGEHENYLASKAAAACLAVKL